MSQRPALPAVTDLTFGQSAGWNCVWCRAPLTTGAVSAGIAEGYSGAHDLSVEVYACPAHANGPTPESGGDE
jgi:hypothetical protein